MKKKSERCSYKKIAQPNRREEIRLNNDSIINDKKKSIKAKSTEKTAFHPDISQKFKFAAKNPVGHIRIKTEVDDAPNKSKLNYNSLFNAEKNDKVKPMVNFNDTKRSERNFQPRLTPQAEQKNKTIKKLRLNHELRTCFVI